MGVQYVKTMNEMTRMNRLFYKRVKLLQGRILRTLADININKSQEIVKKVEFKGTLFSSIQLQMLGAFKYHVIASAPHAKGIEEGIPPSGPGWYYFSDYPLLEEWVLTKLMERDQDKAEYFLKRKAVRVGMSGYPWQHIAGLRFMELGILTASLNADKVIRSELNKIRAWGSATGRNIPIGLFMPTKYPR